MMGEYPDKYEDDFDGPGGADPTGEPDVERDWQRRVDAVRGDPAAYAKLLQELIDDPTMHVPLAEAIAENPQMIEELAANRAAMRAILRGRGRSDAEIDAFLGPGK